VSNQSVTYLVGACLGVFGLAAFCTFVLAPAITAYRRPMERVAVVILSLYVLAALVGRLRERLGQECKQRRAAQQ